MKRSYFLAAGLVALVATGASACHRNDCTSTTRTTSATVNPSEPGLQTPRAATPNSDRTAASPARPEAPAAPPPAAAPAPAGNAASTSGSDATAGAAAGSTATKRGPVDITGPSPAVTTTTPNGNAMSAIPDNIRNMGGTSLPPPAGNAPSSGPGNADAVSTTTTTGAPMVTPGLDNTVTGGVGNIGAPMVPMVNGSGGTWYAAPTSTMSQPIGGEMRPGAASDPNTTAGGGRR